MKDKKNIDRVFQPLNEYSPELSTEQLDDFCVRLDKMRYYRFGWRYFNIYYASIVLTGALFLILILWNNHSDENKSQIKNPSIILYSEQKEAVSSLKNSDSIKISFEEVTSKQKPVHENIPERVKTDSSISLPSTAIPIEKYSIEINHDTFAAHAPPVILVKKRDTIFTFDTTRVKRRKR